MEKLTARERKLVEALFEASVYNKKHTIEDLGTIYIDRDGKRVWNENDRLAAYICIRTGPRILLDLEVFPIYLYIREISKGVEIWWYMPENEWGMEQSNTWPTYPILFKPKDEN